MEARNDMQTASRIGQLTKGFINKLDSIRTEIASVREELVWLDTSPLPLPEAETRIVTWVDAQARKMGDRLSLGSAIRSEGNLGDAELLTVHARGRADIYSERDALVNASADLAPIICWLFPAAVKERLRAELSGLDYEPGPPAEERPSMKARLQDELHRLELIEESLVLELEAAGVEVFRREDADPAVILELHWREAVGDDSELADEKADAPAEPT